MAQNVFFDQFESITQLVRHLDTAEVQPAFKRYMASESHDDDYGYESYDIAHSKLLYGDKELAREIWATGKLKMNVPATGQRNKVVTAVAGFAPHVPNAIAGMPNSMLWVRKVERPAPVLTLVYNVGVTAGYNAEEVRKASARVLSAVMSLERKGVRVNLYVASAQNKSDSHQRCGFIVKIKDAGQYLDPIKVAVPMVSIAMNRRFGFRYRETKKGLAKSWKDGYGSSMRGDDFRNFLKDVNFKYDCALTLMDALRIDSVDELEKLFQNKNLK